MNSPQMRLTIRQLARDLYVKGPPLALALQHYRPYISPFELVVDAVPERSRVLDIGCGGGLVLGLLSKLRNTQGSIGIDSNRQAISLAQDMTERLTQGHGVVFEARDASTPLPSGPFDVVTLLDVMHHIAPAHQRLVLEQAIERVAPGGLFIYKDMVSKPLWRAHANRLHDLVIARQWIHYLPLAQAINWAEQKACVVLERSTVNMLWYGHEIVVFKRMSA